MSNKLRKSLCLLLILTFTVITLSTFTATSASSTDDYLAAYYKFDNSLTDSSPNGNNGSAIGDFTYVPGVNGSAIAFNGSSYIEVNQNDSLNLGKSFTVSVWVYKDYDTSQSYRGIIYKNGDTKVHSAPLSIYDRLLKPTIEVGIPTGSVVLISNTFSDMHKWELLTFTYDGSEIKTYISGKPTDSKPFTNEMMVSQGKLNIGMMLQSSKQIFYQGYMDDLKIYKKALTYDEVKKSYNDIVNGTGKNIVIKPAQQMAYYRFNGNLSDSSGFKNNANVIGNEKYAYSIQNKGFVFDGETYLEVPDSDSLEADSGFTASVWIKANTTKIASGEWPIIQRPQSSIQTRAPAYTFYTRIFGEGKSGCLAFYLINTGNTSPTGSQTRNVDSKIGNWCMLTVTFDDKTKTFTYYLNGTQFEVYNNNLISLIHSGGKLVIGKMDNNKFFKGIMDELRLYNYPMTTGQVKTLYNYRDKLKVTNDSVLLSRLKLKSTTQLKVSAIPPVRTLGNVDVTSVCSYISSNISAAKVSSTGKITAGARGKAKITVTLGPLSTYVNVEVK